MIFAFFLSSAFLLGPAAFLGGMFSNVQWTRLLVTTTKNCLFGVKDFESVAWLKMMEQNLLVGESEIESKENGT